jgi:hypothetical protein
MPSSQRSTLGGPDVLLLPLKKAMSDRRALHLLPVVSRANLFAD